MKDKMINEETILEILRPILRPDKYEYYKTDYESLRIDFCECFAVRANTRREIARRIRSYLDNSPKEIGRLIRELEE